MKRVLCIHDYAGVGRCSLAVIIPTLSAMGVQACALPTALLSTHTLGFAAPAVQATDDFVRRALAHYVQQKITFDAVYSGYLANAAQAALVQQAFAQNPQALKVTDPVLGDGGALYSGITPALCEAMRALCFAADLITPNETEAAFLLDGQTPTADALQQRYSGSTVLTGANGQNAWCTADGAAGALVYTSVNGHFPGTGDLFTAVLTGALVRGQPLAHAVELAAWFVAQAAARTLPSAARCGVEFEPLLGLLAKETEHWTN